MIFQEEHIGWMFGRSPHTGEPKRQTRRPAGMDEWGVSNHDMIRSARVHRLLDVNIGKIFRVEYSDTRTRYELGRKYAIQPGRGKKGVGFIKLVGIKLESEAWMISEKDVREQGFSCAAQFSEVWEAFYGWDGLGLPCWALSFDMVEGCE